jgi:hypothetical protein
MNRENILKIAIYVTGAVCFVVFIAVRFEFLFNAMLREPVVTGYWDKTKYGEMYYFSMISHFKEEGLPPARLKFEYSDKQASIKDCEILTFGDSYFEFSRHKQFPERLADDYSKKVHYVNNDHPLDYLQKNNYNDTVPKLVIFERVERYIPVTFQYEQEWPVDTNKNETSFLSRASNYVIEKIFYSKSEELYDAMLKRSYLTTLPYQVTSTLKFDLFGYISKMTPTYLVNGKDNSWLFYHDQVDGERTSFYYKFTDRQIDSICDNMADLGRKLKETYNMDLVYLPLPSKYTLYHGLLNNDEYNNFMPRLYEGLKKRGVNFIDVYDIYRNYSGFVYYRTDDHWNQHGIDLAYNETVSFLEQNPGLAVYLSEKGVQKDSSSYIAVLPK